MKNPQGAPNMVWGMYILISLNRIYGIKLSPLKISALPGWISISSGVRLVIDALEKKFGALDYHDPRVQEVIQMAKSMELEKSNPGKVRKNIFLFNNPGNAQRILAENFVNGANSGVASSMYIHGNRIYSYGPHFPIAERHTITSVGALAGTPVIIITARKSPSKTTSAQVGLVKAAAQQAGLEIMYQDLAAEAKGPAAYSNPEKGSTRRVKTFYCHCGRRVELEGRDVECEKCGQWYNAFGQKLKDPSKWSGARDYEDTLDNPKGVRKNIFLFNNPRELNAMEQAAHAVGLVFGTWAPGDGQTRYRFFVRKGGERYGDYNQGDGLYTALGRKDAMAFISAYGKGRSARTNPSSVVRTFKVPGGLESQVASMLRSAFIFAQAKDGGVLTMARPEIVKRAIGYVKKHGWPARNPLTRSEAGYLLRHAKADVTEAEIARRFGLTGEQKYATGRARGIGFAVQETGPKSARKAWVDLHTRLDRVTRNPRGCKGICPNPSHSHGAVENPYGRGRERRSYQEYLARKKAEYGSQFDPSDLDPRFVSYYENGKRIWVSDFGHVTSGTVGVTTGWKPVFLLISSSRAMGSSTTLTKKTKILGEVGSYKPRRGEYGEAIENVRRNPLIQTVMLANPSSGAALKRQMVALLKSQFKGLLDDVNSIESKFNIESAIYWFANDYHGGGSSPLYQILSTSQYRPGPIVRGPEDEIEKMMYEALEQKYAKKNPRRRSNPPLSSVWNRLTSAQRQELLEISGVDRAVAEGMSMASWSGLRPRTRSLLEMGWYDPSRRTSGDTTRRIPMTVGARNPLTRGEAGSVLRDAHHDIALGASFGHGFTRHQLAGQAFARAKVVRKHGPVSASRPAMRIADRAQKLAGTIMSNPGALRLPKPGTKMTVAQALDLARRIGDKDLIKQCQEAIKLQGRANASAKTVTWKHLPMGSKTKVEAVVALVHYGDSPETMYKPPVGSKKGNHMYRHSWGETGGKRSVPLLAAPGGKALIMPLEGKKVAGDWLRH